MLGTGHELELLRTENVLKISYQEYDALCHANIEIKADTVLTAES